MAGVRQLFGVPILRKIAKENLAFEQSPEERWGKNLRTFWGRTRKAGAASVALSEFTAAQGPTGTWEGKIAASQNAFQAKLSWPLLTGDF